MKGQWVVAIVLLMAMGTLPLTFINTPLLMSSLQRNARIGESADRLSFQVGGTPLAEAEGVAVELIVQGTDKELLDLSPLLFIERRTHEENISSYHGAADETQAGPLLLLVQAGEIQFSSNETATGPVLLKRHNEQDVVVLTPNSDVMLLDGDALFLPGDAEHGFAFRADDSPGPAVIYAVRVFPWSSGADTEGNPREEQLDLDLGIATANSPVPEFISASRIAVETGQSFKVGDQPRLFYVVSGEAMLMTSNRKIEIRREEASVDSPVEILAPQSTTALFPGDAVFIQIGSQTTITNSSSEPLRMLMVALDI